MADSYIQQGFEVYSLGFDSITDETSRCYNCKGVNLTFLFVITSFGGTSIIEHASGATTETKLAVIFLLCPFCARKYNEDPSIENKAVEEFKTRYKAELVIASTSYVAS